MANRLTTNTVAEEPARAGLEGSLQGSRGWLEPSFEAYARSLVSGSSCESIRLVAMSIRASGAARLDTSPMEPSHTRDP
ncbi:hypothetical protein SAMN02799642_02372 [Methylobacterium brachiatum]|nr:hypothetical protein SAMN02799642_02372 [Methylobacterium brachiatum]